MTEDFMVIAAFVEGGRTWVGAARKVDLDAWEASGGVQIISLADPLRVVEAEAMGPEGQVQVNIGVTPFSLTDPSNIRSICTRMSAYYLPGPRLLSMYEQRRVEIFSNITLARTLPKANVGPKLIRS